MALTVVPGWVAQSGEWQRDPETRIDNRRSTWRTRRRAHPGLLDPHRSPDGNVDEFIKLPHRVSSEVDGVGTSDQLQSVVKVPTQFRSRQHVCRSRLTIWRAGPSWPSNRSS